MSSLLIENGHVVTLDDENRFIENGSIYIEDTKIVEIGVFPTDKYTPDRIIDAGARLVMPGLINTHHHLYSTFARGFTPPGPPPWNFEEILSSLWWKLDKALDAEDVYYSALLALIDSAHAGCTTIIDHHASPSCWDGSLDQIERAFRDVGLSGCLSYEVSDRNCEGEGIEENERYIRKCRDAERRPDGGNVRHARPDDAWDQDPATLRIHRARTWMRASMYTQPRMRLTGASPCNAMAGG